MGRPPKNNNLDRKPGLPAESKYDAEFKVMKKTYGNFADLRRELSDSVDARADRKRLLDQFARCDDQQRAFLIIEDYFEKLSLTRKDFHGQEWWTQVMEASGDKRLEEVALAFMQSGHPIPTELLPHANFEKFAVMEASRANLEYSDQLDQWLFPGGHRKSSTPRSSLRVICELQPLEDPSALHRMVVHFLVFRPRTGERVRSPQEIVELTQRASQEQELFIPEDWAFIRWAGKKLSRRTPIPEILELKGLELLEWMTEWSGTRRFELSGHEEALMFTGQTAEFHPTIRMVDEHLQISHQLRTQSHPDGIGLNQISIIHGSPYFALCGLELFVLRNPPPEKLLRAWMEKPWIEVENLSSRLLTRLRKSFSAVNPLWDQVCDAHTARPRMLFEIRDESVQIRLEAISDRDESHWLWDGDQWMRSSQPESISSRPEVLDDPRLQPAIDWLKQLQCFTPEHCLWVADADPNFFDLLAAQWNDRPSSTEFLGNALFHRLFLGGHKLRPRLAIQSTGIDWFSVSTEWEMEGLKLSQADLHALQSATSRFVKLPDSGWVELDEEKVISAHETMAELGVDGLMPVPQKVSFSQASSQVLEKVDTLGEAEKMRDLRRQIAEFRAIDNTDLPPGIQAELRPYQKDGFNFLTNLFQSGLGGLLADDMGLGKTLQTLVALEWIRQNNRAHPQPSLVICPASVLHNWKREANRFVPSMKVLVLESGKERHNLRDQIPDFDLIVTNYALLRRDLQALRKFHFLAVVLDEAQFIKNPGAQVTLSVKQLRATHRVALSGTPLENRLLDLWSIIDFLQRGYLGSQSQFVENYQSPNEAVVTQRIARKRLAAKLRPILLRRLKTQVARDLPERIEERRDCALGKAQRKLYLAELRRSREQVHQAVHDNGIQKSRIHVLAALTRLRQICCHPRLIGSDSISGKTQTLFELVEPLLERGEKVLLFSQFVKMLNILESEFEKIGQKTYTLTGETRNRQEVVQKFQDDTNPAVFLLSLRAAGTGLNLTTASYVVLYDPWWNPAVEAQAIDRSHRIGQTKTVNAYRLVTPGTVEEKIWELQQKKSQQITDILGEDGFTGCLSHEDLDYLFAEEDIPEE
ncbi:MAG: DEAD/DEAH box helicase [Verrucomicrobia bacterium]|nr:DEAD/DEAH box helicase [Verrucomicrobiota bacterium]